jgi:hypothetical protein
MLARGGGAQLYSGWGRPPVRFHRCGLTNFLGEPWQGVLIGCCLVLADKLQYATIPDLWLLPMSRVPGFGHGGELAIGDMRR